MNRERKCAVIGYGSWATTLVSQLAMNGLSINWLVTNPDVTAGLLDTGRNPKYVRDVDIDLSNITIIDDIDRVVNDAYYVLLACPSAYLKNILDKITVPVADKFFISAIKGIEPSSEVTILEYVNKSFDIPFKQLSIISGPTHAEEVSRGEISYLTAAAASEETAAEVAELFRSRSLEVNISTDIYGIEYAGVLKNIYAIMAGIATGLGYGDNFVAVLVAKAASEMAMFLEKSYSFERNITDRAYLGDLLVTCYSNFSRNRRLGQLIGKGCTVKSALNEMTMIAEGYFSCHLIMNVCKRFDINMPIAQVAYDILYNNASARRSFAQLAEQL